MSNFNIPKHITTVQLQSGQEFIIKDWRGFSVFRIDGNGYIYIKNKQVKI